MARVTEYRCDPDLTEILVKQSLPTVHVDAQEGRALHRGLGPAGVQRSAASSSSGAGSRVEAVGGGPGLVDSLTQIAKKNGIEIWYNARALSLIADDDGVHGVVVRKNQAKPWKSKARPWSSPRAASRRTPSGARATWARAGNSPRCAARASTPATRIRMALDIGAAAHGNWSGCHAVAWDRNAPETGDLAVGDGFQKHSYPWGVYINAEGKRFVDEGADFRNYTYAKYGRVILQQPRQFAWQIFDGKVKQQLRDEYRIKQVTKVTGNTLEELVSKLDDTDQKAALEDAQEIQRRGADRDPVQPERQGRALHRRASR